MFQLWRQGTLPYVTLKNENTCCIRNSFRGPGDVEKKFKMWDENCDNKISFEELKVKKNDLANCDNRSKSQKERKIISRQMVHPANDQNRNLGLTKFLN